MEIVNDALTHLDAKGIASLIIYRPEVADIATEFSLDVLQILRARRSAVSDATLEAVQAKVNLFAGHPSFYKITHAIQNRLYTSDDPFVQRIRGTSRMGNNMIRIGKDILVWLVTNGADINGAYDESGIVPLMTTVRYSADDADGQYGVRHLLELGADPNRSDKNGWTPLMLAVYQPRGPGDYDIRSDPACIEPLLEAGADPYAINSHGRTIQTVAHPERWAIVQRFLDRRALAVQAWWSACSYRLGWVSWQLVSEGLMS